MTAVTVTIRNGVDTEKLFATLGLIEAQPEAAVWEQSTRSPRPQSTGSRKPSECAPFKHEAWRK